MSNPLDLTALLNSAQNRLVIQATLKPVAEKTRFQPAGFPEIGHVIYDAPQGNGTKQKVCIVDSAASMANHLETVCVERDLTLVPDLAGLPYVQCVTGDNKDELVVTTLSEGHRLASSYFLEGKRFDAGNNPETDKFSVTLRNEFGLRDLGNHTHPLPAQWWNIFKTIFRYDPNSLVHGILFPALGIKLPRVLTATLDAFGAERVATSGVKFDKLGKTNSGQPIFAKDEETATEIRATFVVDLSLVRSFGRGDDTDAKGLNAAQKQLLLGLALWKINKLLATSFRFRSECDLELADIKIDNADSNISALNLPIAQLIAAAYPAPASEASQGVTKVYWNANDLFKVARDKEERNETDSTDGETENTDESGANDGDDD